MQAQVSGACGAIVALLLIAGCSGGSGLDAPKVEFTTPSNATQITSDRPEVPGGPPAEPPLSVPTPSQ